MSGERTVYVCHTDKGQAMVKVLQISSDMTLDAVKAAAGEIVGASAPIQSLTLQNGLEITSVSDIQPDDVLYCGLEGAGMQPNSGSNPLAGEVAVPAWQASDMAPEYKERFLCSLASSIAGVASSLYGKSSAAVKNHTPAVVGSAIDRAESKVSALSQHTIAQSLLAQAISYGEWMDDQIDSSLSKVRHKKEAIVCSPAVQTINTKVVKPVQQGVQARVIEPSKAFLSSANGVFRHLQQRAVASGTAAKVSAEDFMAALKQRIGHHWSAGLVEPARAFHEAATRNIDSARETLGRAWEERVVAAWRSQQGTAATGEPAGESAAPAATS